MDRQLDEPDDRRDMRHLGRHLREAERAGDPLEGLRRVRALIKERHGAAPPGWAADAVRQVREDFSA